MRGCFEFLVQECQNASLETGIKSAKFSHKIPIVSEDMDKMLTEFPQSGMHKGALWLVQTFRLMETFSVCSSFN